MSQRLLTGVIIGAGHRSHVYASHALRLPDELKIVGLAEPDPVRREVFRERYSIPAEKCYDTAEELAAQPQFAELAINGTMDRLHVPTALPLLEAGYDMLLEKPITPVPTELIQLANTVERTGRKLVIGHVLRYAPFYVAMRERILAGDIGEVLSIHTSERVSYHHMAVGFVRGKWNRRETQSPILLAKCCHDLDLIAWLKSGVAPARVQSFGNLMHFTEELAPEGHGTRCLTDCRIEADCPYSARKNYLDQNLWGTYVWHCIEHLGTPTLEQKIESLSTDNPLGRCVWASDNNVVDHQTVAVEFADGALASHRLDTGTARPCRTLHVVGTTGEIEGDLEHGKFVVRHPDARAKHEYSTEEVDLNVSMDMHGGGDHRLAADFLRVVRGEQPSISTTALSDSLNGHLIAYAADLAMTTRQTVEMPGFVQGLREEVARG